MLKFTTCSLVDDNCSTVDFSQKVKIAMLETDLAIDTKNSKFIIAATGSMPLFLDMEWQYLSQELILFRCSLDLTDCSTQVAVNGLNDFGFNPSLAIDETNDKLIIATYADSNFMIPILYHCSLTNPAESCTYFPLSFDFNSGNLPAIAIDKNNQKVLIATQNDNNLSRLSLFRCDLNDTVGSTCLHHDISTISGEGMLSGLSPKILVDDEMETVLIIAQNGFTGKALFYKCNSDITSCQSIDVSAGQNNNSGFTPDMVLDNINNRLLIVTDNGANDNKISLFRCSRAGQNCQHMDVSAGQESRSGVSPKIIIDTKQEKIKITTLNRDLLETPSLYTLPLDFSF